MNTGNLMTETPASRSDDNNLICQASQIGYLGDSKPAVEGSIF